MYSFYILTEFTRTLRSNFGIVIASQSMKFLENSRDQSEIVIKPDFKVIVLRETVQEIVGRIPAGIF